MKKTKVFKNGVAGLWLFLIVVALIGYQINNISTYGYYVENTNFFSKANIALWIITMFFGYFLVKHVKECKEKSASTAALKYTGFQLKKLLPLLGINAENIHVLIHRTLTDDEGFAVVERKSESQ